MKVEAAGRLALCSQDAPDKKLEGHPRWSCAPGTRAL
jgi:hypothetical protein